MGGGLLASIGSHIVDIVTFLTSKRAIRVHGVMKTFTKNTEKIKGIRWIDSDDFCTFQMILSDDLCVSVSLNSHFAGQPFSQVLTLMGKEGRLSIEGATLRVYKKETEFAEEVLVDAQDDPYTEGLVGLVCALSASLGMENWCEGPLGSAATFEDELYVQTVIDAIRLSSNSR